MAYYYVSDNFLIGSLFSTSPVILNEKVLCGVIISASTISGSYLSFLGSKDGINYYPVLDSTSSEVILITTASPRAYSLKPESFYGVNFVRARLGYSGSSVMQKTYNTPVDFIMRDI